MPEKAVGSPPVLEDILKAHEKVGRLIHRTPVLSSRAVDGLCGASLSIAVSSVSPSTLIIGAEPKGADDAFRSLQAGRIIPVRDPNTIADGLRTSLGDLTFPIISRLVKEIFTVSEKGIIDAMRIIWERMKIIIEPSSAVPLAAVLEQKARIAGKRIGIILSGGNVDLERLPWC